VGTYGTKDDIPSTNFYVRFPYVDGERRAGKGTVGSYFVTLEDVDLKEDMVFEIDSMFLNSPDPASVEIEAVGGNATIAADVGSRILVKDVRGDVLICEDKGCWTHAAIAEFDGSILASDIGAA